MGAPSAAPQSRLGWNGVILIDKPEGITSHDVIDAVRRVARQRRVGHAGTLDPLATGLLVVALGVATRLLRFLPGTPKVYRTVARLGVETDTGDALGRPLAPPARVDVSDESLERALASLRGRITQLPPIYSAKKIGGRRLHRAARSGEVLLPHPIEVEIYELRVLGRDAESVELEIHCSPGTYVRSLVTDLGRKLATGATVARLRRLRSGCFDVADARPLSAIMGESSLADRLQPIDALPLTTPEVQVDDPEAAAFAAGREIRVEENALGEVDVAVRCAGRLVGFGRSRQIDGTSTVAPRVVLLPQLATAS